MIIIETAKDTNYRLTQRLEKEIIKDDKSVNNEKILINIDDSKQYQKIIGFGGALTEAAAVTLNKMSKEKREEAIKMYYDPSEGLNYTIGRVHIHSCDFALENYTYVDENDISLESFNISRDYKTIIPLIKDAQKYTKNPLKLLASPWSPPAWMKSNKQMNHGGKLLEEYHDLWALYYTKFIKKYKEENINIWGITVQNEPAAKQTWDSCIYTAEEERDFVKNYLGPIMHKEGLEDVKILIWDHNRDIMVERATIVLSDLEAAKYIWGTGFHWYVSEEFDNVGKVNELFPDKHLLFTEGCQEGGVHLGSWLTGERYGRNMIGDISNGCEGYLDWNIVLDETGGPNHVMNLCDAPIIADTTTDELYYNSSYYYIGHFSKYVLPRAVRIECSCNSKELYTIAFKNEENSIVIIVMNETDKDIEYQINYNEKSINTVSLKHSIRTYVL